MATVSQEFPATAAELPAANAAQPDLIDGTNFPIAQLRFDAAADEEAYFPFRAVSYGSGNLTVDIDWYADNATTGDVVWAAAIAAITPNTDTQDIETDALAAENTVTDTHLGTTGQRLHRATITLSNLDGLASGDDVTLRIRRLGSNLGDTMANDAALRRVTVSYSDT